MRQKNKSHQRKPPSLKFVNNFAYNRIFSSRSNKRSRARAHAAHKINMHKKKISSSCAHCVPSGIRERRQSRARAREKEQANEWVLKYYALSLVHRHIEHTLESMKAKTQSHTHTHTLVHSIKQNKLNNSTPKIWMVRACACHWKINKRCLFYSNQFKTETVRLNYLIVFVRSLVFNISFQVDAFNRISCCYKTKWKQSRFVLCVCLNAFSHCLTVFNVSLYYVYVADQWSKWVKSEKKIFSNWIKSWTDTFWSGTHTFPIWLNQAMFGSIFFSGDRTDCVPLKSFQESNVFVFFFSFRITILESSFVCYYSCGCGCRHK